VLVGQQLSASVVARDQNGDLIDALAYTWALGNTSVAQFSALPTDGPSVDVTGVAPGSTVGTVTSGGATHSFPVNVTAASATLTLSPTSVAFAMDQGASPPPSMGVAVMSVGSGSLGTLAIGSIQWGPGASGWLTATLDRTTAPATTTISVAPSGLAAGTYTAQIPVVAQAAANSPQVIHVTLDVRTPPPPGPLPVGIWYFLGRPFDTGSSYYSDWTIDIRSDGTVVETTGENIYWGGPFAGQYTTVATGKWKAMPTGTLGNIAQYCGPNPGGVISLATLHVQTTYISAVPGSVGRTTVTTGTPNFLTYWAYCEPGSGGPASLRASPLGTSNPGFRLGS